MSKIIKFSRAERRQNERDIEKLKKINRSVESLCDVDFSGLKFPVIVLFNRPLDFPDGLVARIFELERPTNCVCEYRTVEEAREDAQRVGFTHIIPRSKNDDIHIVESYIRG